MESSTVQSNNQTPFQRFLLANRPFCEICSGPYPSTRIIKHKGHDTAVCDAHYRTFGQDEWEQMSSIEKDYYIGIIPPK